MNWSEQEIYLLHAHMKKALHRYKAFRIWRIKVENLRTGFIRFKSTNKYRLLLYASVNKGSGWYMQTLLRPAFLAS